MSKDGLGHVLVVEGNVRDEIERLIEQTLGADLVQDVGRR
jgi:hypothetical protein